MRWPTLGTSMKTPILRCCRTTGSASKTYFALQTQSLPLSPALLSISAQVYSVGESPGRRGSGYWNRTDRDVLIFPRCRRLGVCLQHRSCSRKAADLGRVRPLCYLSALSNSHRDCLETAAEQGQACLQGKVLSFPCIFSHSLCKPSQKKDVGERMALCSRFHFLFLCFPCGCHLWPFICQIEEDRRVKIKLNKLTTIKILFTREIRGIEL